MAAHDVKAFLDKVDSDPALRKEVRGAVNHITQVAKNHGFHFSEAELRNHLRERWGITSSPNYDTQHDTCFFA